MFRSSFARGLVFAFCAGVATIPWLLASVQWLGFDAAALLYWAGALVLYPLFIAPSLRRGIAGSILSAVLVFAPLVTFPDLDAMVVLGPLLIGIVRSGILYPRPLSRALLFEAVCGLAALVLAALVYERDPWSTACAVWSFYLVQSVFPLTLSNVKVPCPPPVDPFEAAKANAESVLARARVGSRADWRSPGVQGTRTGF